MKWDNKKAFWFSILLIVGLVLLPTAKVFADIKKPYFTVTGGDVFVGGWFNNGRSVCTNIDNPNYQAPTYNPPTLSYLPPNSVYKGGILAYNKVNGNNHSGASADFGALALGLIEGKNSLTYGFATGITDSINSESFANMATASDYWGGLLGGASGQTHCIPDYYGTKQDSPDPWSGELKNAATGQYTKDASGAIWTLNSDEQKIQNDGRNVSLFVKGNVYIDGNIKYAGGYDGTKVPHFVLVVQGNIFVDPSVTRLDGWYIAQPDLSSQSSIDGTGAFWSCHDNSLNVPSPAFIYNCNDQLTINGALTAKIVLLTRNRSNIGNNDNSDRSEYINYLPENIIGGPFFNLPVTSGGGTTVDSLVSLPPIF